MLWYSLLTWSCSTAESWGAFVATELLPVPFEEVVRSTPVSWEPAEGLALMIAGREGISRLRRLRLVLRLLMEIPMPSCERSLLARGFRPRLACNGCFGWRTREMLMGSRGNCRDLKTVFVNVVFRKVCCRWLGFSGDSVYERLTYMQQGPRNVTMPNISTF